MHELRETVLVTCNLAKGVSELERSLGIFTCGQRRRYKESNNSLSVLAAVTNLLGRNCFSRNIDSHRKIILTAKAFLLINIELGGERNAIKELGSVPNVKEVHLTYEVYDIITKIEGESQVKVKETITNSFSLMSKVQFLLRMDLF